MKKDKFTDEELLKLKKEYEQMAVYGNVKRQIEILSSIVFGKERKGCC